ncbi:MAG: hypothetical protein AAF366_20395, partial [Pseudomonadota bacterium]
MRRDPGRAIAAAIAPEPPTPVPIRAVAQADGARHGRIPALVAVPSACATARIGTGVGGSGAMAAAMA